MNVDDKQGTVVHFVANVGGGVWSVAKTLAAHHRPRWRVLLVAMYKGELRPAFAAEAEHCFDAAHLVRKPRLPGIYYLAPVSVRAATEALGVDATAESVVYHFHTGPYTPFVYRLPRGVRPGKWLACFHGSRGNFGDVNNLVKRRVHVAGVRRMLRDQMTLVAVSKRSASDCAEMYGCRPTDFHVVYNGTSTQAGTGRPGLARTHRPFRVGFVGTVTPIKGWHKVVGAVHRLREEGLNVACSIVGDGPGYPKLKSLALRHADWLDAPGHVQKPEENVFPSLDLLVLPSDFEGHPEVLLEAMACGVPCLCSDVGGCAETIRHGREGYILRDGSVGEIAGYVRRVMNGNGSWAAMSRNCVTRHGEMFTAQRMAASWEQLYLEDQGGVDQ
jgi:glycosyltransferase involved in cell wall biosynthesis